jgi:hypothetical protein
VQIDLDAANRDPMLRHTPMGRVILRRMGGQIAMCVDAGCRRERVVQYLDDRGVHALFHGKAFWLRAAVHALWQKANQREMEALERERQARVADRRKAFWQFMKREAYAREAMALHSGVRRPRGQA